MILGFDHLSYSSTDLDRSAEKLRKLGYTEQFSETGLENYPVKKPLLEEFQPLHGLRYFKHSNGFALEATYYRDTPATSSGLFQIDLENPEIISLHTRRPDKEYRFWTKGFGFKEQDEGKLAFTTPVPQWNCTLQLVKDDRAGETSYLDSSGYPCMAFLCTRLEEELKNLQEAGAHTVVDPHQIEVNSKLLTLTMFRSPSGAVCELIQIDKQ